MSRHRLGKPVKWLLAVGLVLLLLPVAGAVIMTLLQWRPEPLSDTPVRGQAAASGTAPVALSVLSWNIGYAALDAEADFFMDGGHGVRAPSRQRVERNLQAIARFLAGQSADLLLLQEVDRASSRSHYIDQADMLVAALPGRQWSYAPNFRVAWIPVPLLRPLGRVESGLLSLSRYPLKRALRHQLPGQYAWPVRLFHLKRCLHELRLPAPDGHDWVILHLHLSAFDRDGRLRRQQLAYLRRLLAELVAAGHHPVVGGDWNHAPPGVTGESFPHRAPTPGWFQRLPADWPPPGFQLAFDTSRPSLRATNQPYRRGENFLTVVDGFLVGPGIEVVEVTTFDLGFEHSDHNPVLLRVRLSPGGSGVGVRTGAGEK